MALPRHLPRLFGGRARTSTVVLVALFLALLGLYILVRPVPTPPVQGTRTGQVVQPKPSPTPRRTPATPTATPTPAPTQQSPTASTTPSVVPTPAVTPTATAPASVPAATPSTVPTP